MRNARRALLFLQLSIALTSARAEDSASRDFPLGSAGHAPRLEAVAGPCENGSRTLRVQLTSEGAAKASATMPEPWDTLPCGLTRSSRAGWQWAGGEEEQLRSLSVRGVALGQDTTGLLISVEGGFEHVRRHHVLFVPGPTGATRVWEGTEPQGPSTGSSATPRGDAILFLNTDHGGAAGLEDIWKLTRVTWDAKRRKVTEAPASAWAVLLATEDSLTKARATEAKLEEATGNKALLVLPTDDFPKLKPGLWVVGLFFPSRQEAEHMRVALEPKAKGFVRRVR
ncbi:hypothetical protein ACN469_00345 [Corallococcus terminator]